MYVCVQQVMEDRVPMLSLALQASPVARCLQRSPPAWFPPAGCAEEHLLPCLAVPQVQDSVAANIPHLLIAPVLVLTMLLGPMGLLAYFAVRTLVGVVRRKDRTSGAAKTD